MQRRSRGFCTSSAALKAVHIDTTRARWPETPLRYLPFDTLVHHASPRQEDLNADVLNLTEFFRDGEERFVQRRAEIFPSLDRTRA